MFSIDDEIDAYILASKFARATDPLKVRFTGAWHIVVNRQCRRIIINYICG
jgi:hypothetical protein